MDALPVDFDRLARDLQLAPEQVSRTVALLDDGNTVPFITRYRKEQTGNLDEQQIRTIQSRMRSLRQLAERAATILRQIESQGKLTDALRRKIEQAESLKTLEDLYLPFRPKRRSRAEIARERGLGPLAERVWNREQGLGALSDLAARLVAPAKELPDVEAVIDGIRDILAERIQEDAGIRELVRRFGWRSGRLQASAAKSAEATSGEYRDYAGYEEPVSAIPPHRVLALNRGEREKELRVKLAWDTPAVQSAIERQLALDRHPQAAIIREAVAESLSRFLHPAIEREVRRELTDRAHAHAVEVFARNLRSLLLQPPLTGRRVLAIDPGLRTGCKVVVLDELGRPVVDDVLFITGSDERRQSASRKLVELVKAHGCEVIAIGNGTACRETEQLAAEVIGRELPDVRYVIVNEAGASIYSASPAGRDEFPELDATVRGTISIGRRLLDPLSELVKIDPQHLGVGMYQHDVQEKKLRESLQDVIESCVNYVGVDLNRASATLLSNVSGFNQRIARGVVQWREEHGPFRNRLQLREVNGIGENAFTQAAGFLRITDGDQPLDGTWIHPESYPAATRILQHVGLTPEQLLAPAVGGTLADKLAGLDVDALARALQIGRPTCADIIDALRRPGRDPRCDHPGPVFKQGILKLDDLAVGMELTGTVLNVVDFGAFVDIGLKSSGLVHISRLAAEYVRNPHDYVAVGDIVTVWVDAVDRDRGRVSLSMIPPPESDH